MPRREREPNALPKELADFLKDRPYACVTERTDQGTVLVIKTPNRGHPECPWSCAPIQIWHGLFNYPSVPVIRMTVRIYDQSQHPLALETFINVEDPQQRADYQGFAKQETIYMLFYDETLRHRLSKGVNNSTQEEISLILNQSNTLLSAIPKDRFDFDRAKKAVMERMRL